MGAAAAQLEQRMGADAVNRRLASRPSAEELHDKGILKVSRAHPRCGDPGAPTDAGATAPSPGVLQRP